MDDFFDETPIFSIEWPLSYWAVVWRLCLGVAAFLDFLATVLPDLLRIEVDEQGNTKNREIFRTQQYIVFGKSIPETTPLGASIRWLDDNVAYVGFMFSVLCFLEAFLDAKRSRDRAMLENDRRKLLAKSADDEDSIAVIDDLGYLEADLGSWVTFYFSLFLQLLLLPAGFYWLMSQGLFLEAEAELGVLGQEQGGKNINSVLRKTYKVDDYMESSSSSQQTTTMSLGFAILAYSFNTVFKNTRMAAEKAVHKQVAEVIKRLLRSAIRNPRQFGRRVKKVLTVTRWVKYIQPIFGAINKFKGNMLDLTKKFRQRQRALVAKKIRRVLFHQMTTAERREHAARKIQSLYRSYRTRKTIWAINLIKGKKEALAAIKLQSIFRTKLAQARKRLRKKRLELQKLKAKVRKDLKLKNNADHKLMSAEERKRLYELEEDLQMETAKIINRRLLLRPDTTFSIAWKTMFVVCVLVEITGLVWNPILKKYKDTETGDSLTISSALKQYVIPPPVSSIAECTCGDDFGGRVRWQAKLLEAMKLKKQRQCGPKPWFCEAPYSTAREIYRYSIEFLIDRFLVIVGFVMFLDVPVSFFTGEIDNDAGVLQPKPWFQRWILPGLILQLAVNPRMKTTSGGIKKLISQIFQIGPIRVFRWTSAFFYPLFLVALDFLERNVWSRLAREQKHHSVLDEATSMVMQKQKDFDMTVKMLT